MKRQLYHVRKPHSMVYIDGGYNTPKLKMNLNAALYIAFASDDELKSLRELLRQWDDKRALYCKD